MAILFLSRISLIGVFITSVNGFVDSSVPHVTSCRDNWVAFEGSCYLFGHHNSTFTEAAHFCQIYSAHLVHIDSSAENRFLNDHIRYIIGAGRWWMGLTDEIIEGDWRWIDTDKNPTYTDWAPGEPNNSGNRENCGVLYASGYTWNDIPCSMFSRPICEKRKV